MSSNSKQLKYFVLGKEALFLRCVKTRTLGFKCQYKPKTLSDVIFLQIQADVNYIRWSH